MKNWSNILSIIAIGAVILLYILAFNKKPGSTLSGSASTIGKSGGLQVVYVNEDSLFSGYDYFREQSEIIAEEERKATESLQAKQRALENEIRKVQQQVQQGLLAPNQIAREEQRIAQQQQAFMAESQQASQSLMVQTQALQIELNEKIKEILEDLQDKNGYDFVLNYGPGTGVLIVSDSLDITGLVLERLNQVELDVDINVDSTGSDN